MAQAFMQGHMERPTDTLLNVDIKRQIEGMFDASYLIEKGQYGPGGKLLSEIHKYESSKQIGGYSSFLLEVRFNMILSELYGSRDYPVSMSKLMDSFTQACENLLEQISKQEDIYIESEDQSQWPFANSLRIRIYTVLLQLSIKSGLGNDEQWVNQLIQLLKGQGQKYLPEVIGKLTGCKDLKKFCFNFNSDQILDNDQFLQPYQRKTPSQKAKLIDIASSWFIINSYFQKGIQLKEKALSLWKQANNLKEYERCQIEYMELKSNTNSQFCIRLKRLAKTVSRIYKSFQLQKTTKKQQKWTSLIVKKGLAKTMKSIEKFNDELDKRQEQIVKANKKKSLWQSSKKETTLSTKKSLVNNSKILEYYTKAYQFRTECYSKEKHEQITSLIENSSKFILQQEKKISKAIVKIIKIYTMRRRWAFLTLKNWYIIKHGILKQDFLVSLGLNNLSQKKNSLQSQKFPIPQKKYQAQDSQVEPVDTKMFNTFADTAKFASGKKNN